jgi:hypothetical protein
VIIRLVRGFAGLLFLLSGCSIKSNLEKDIYVSSINPFFVAIDSGTLHSEKIYNSSGNEIGLKVEKEHFLLGKIGEQELYLPENARNIYWIYERNLLGMKFHVDYDLDEERKFVDFILTENATKMRRENR